MKEFEELTGIKVGFEQIPEQQQRPKVAMEMATGHPSFDVVNIGMHVQKRLDREGEMDGGPASVHRRQVPDLSRFRLADFSEPSMKVATGPDGKINVLPLNQDLFILFYNKDLLAEKGFNAPPKTYDEMFSMAKALTDPSKQHLRLRRPRPQERQCRAYDNILLGLEQETVTPDGKKLLTDTPAAIDAGE